MIVAAAGAVDPDRLLAAGRAAVRASGAAAAAAGAAGALRRRRAARGSASSSRCIVALAFEAPGVRDDAAYAAQIYATRARRRHVLAAVPGAARAARALLHDLRPGRGL